MTGFYNNLHKLTESVRSGKIVIDRFEGGYVFSGKTYEIKDFLKVELDCKWDAENKAWRASNLDEPKINLIEGIIYEALA